MYNTGTGFDQTNHNTGTGISNFKGTFNGPIRADVGGVIRNVHTKYLIGSMPASGSQVTVSTGLVNVTYLSHDGLVGTGNNVFIPSLGGLLDEGSDTLSFFINSSNHGQQYRIKIEYYV